MNRRPDQFFPVSCHRRGADANPFAAELADPDELLQHDFDRLAVVGAVKAVQQPTVRADQAELCRGAAAVDAEIGVAGIGFGTGRRHRGFGVARAEPIVFRLAGKKRPKGFCRRLFLQRTGQPRDQLRIGHRLLRFFGINRRAESNREAAVFREPGVCLIEPERLSKSAAQSPAVIERTAQKHHVSFYSAPLRKPCDRLVDDCLVNARGNILLARSLIEQRLQIGFCKHAAARRDGIDPLATQAQFIKLAGRHAQKRRHLVDKRTGSARAAAVHAFVHAAAEEDNLRILAAKLNHHIGIWRKPTDRFSGGEHFLHKRDSGGARFPKPRRTGNCRQNRFSLQKPHRTLHKLQRFLPNMRKMAFIPLILNYAIFLHNNFCRGGAHINSQHDRHLKDRSFRLSSTTGLFLCNIVAHSILFFNCQIVNKKATVFQKETAAKNRNYIYAKNSCAIATERRASCA